MPPGRVSRVGRIEFLARSALVDTTDTKGKEPLAVRPDDPGRCVPLFNCKRRVAGGRFGCCGSVHAWREREYHCGNEAGVLQQAAAGELAIVHHSLNHQTRLMTLGV